MARISRTATSRRRFLAGAGLAGAAASVAAASPAPVGVLDAAARATVVLHDPQFTLDADLAARLAGNGARVIPLHDEAVRLWRGELAPLLGDAKTRLFGVTRWADLLIVRGLAADTRRHLRHEQFHPESGYFTWLID